MSNPRFRTKLYLAVLWLVFTSSFIVWWMYFALSLIARYTPEHESYRTMLLTEGTTMLALLLIGGAAVVYLINQENRQRQRLADFFSTFSHDVKTALASLRLQTESLQEDVQDSNQKKLLGRLVADTSRLLVRIENSLFLGQSTRSEPLLESIQMAPLVEEFQSSWPQVEVAFSGLPAVRADRRALNSIFQNLIHNAVSHASAKKVEITVTAGEGDRACFRVRNDGGGFKGDVSKLGKRFYRHAVGSGSGLGLSIVTDLVKQMNGRGPFYTTDTTSFSVSFELPQTRRLL